MEGFSASTAPNRPSELHVASEQPSAWPQSEHADLLEQVNQDEAWQLIKPMLPIFSGNLKSTLSHLTTIHNESCGCQTGSSTHEAINRVWNQKKVLFMELQKQCGIEEFEDFLNRVLRLILTNSIRDIPPLTEAEFWPTLRTTYPETKALTMPNMEEDLADINNLIAKDLGDPNFDQPDLYPDPAASASTPQSFTPNPGGAASPYYSNVDELLRLKRKEKHMAPIDCTGVSSAFNMAWKCKHCDSRHTSKEDCEHYKYLHQPRHIIYNDPGNVMDLPQELEMREDGVYAGKLGLKPYTRLGPLKGEVRLESNKNLRLKYFGPRPF